MSRGLGRVQGAILETLASMGGSTRRNWHTVAQVLETASEDTGSMFHGLSRAAIEALNPSRAMTLLARRGYIERQYVGNESQVRVTKTGESAASNWRYDREREGTLSQTKVKVKVGDDMRTLTVDEAAALSRDLRAQLKRLR